MHDGPADGDVLITTEHGVLYLSVVPHPHRVSFAELPRAREIAERWADAQRVNVWHKRDGVPLKLPRKDGRK